MEVKKKFEKPLMEVVQLKPAGIMSGSCVCDGNCGCNGQCFEDCNTF